MLFRFFVYFNLLFVCFLRFISFDFVFDFFFFSSFLSLHCLRVIAVLLDFREILFLSSLMTQLNLSRGGYFSTTAVLLCICTVLFQSCFSHRPSYTSSKDQQRRRKYSKKEEENKGRKWRNKTCTKRKLDDINSRERERERD